MKDLEGFDDPQQVDTRPAGQRDVVLWVPAEIGGKQPIPWNVPRLELVEQFRVLLSTARDEKPLQSFFESNPVVLLLGIVSPHSAWSIPRPRLPKPNGGCWIPDFVVCEWSSVGPEWFIVELESPTASPLTESGDVRQICNHAVNQINTYRQHIEEHGHFLRGNGWPKLHAQANGIVVIGRRDDPLRAGFPDTLAQFRRQNIEVMSYDRLFEAFERFQQMLDIWRRQTESLVQSPKPPNV